MATRYYLASSGSQPVSPAFDSWTDTTVGTIQKFPMATTKAGSAIQGTIYTTNANAEGNGSSVLFAQFVGPQIGSVNFNGTTFSTVAICDCTGGATWFLDVSVRLYHVGGTFTGLLAIAASPGYDSAISSSAVSTRIVNAASLANVTSTNNDRLVIEYRS